MTQTIIFSSIVSAHIRLFPEAVAPPRQGFKWALTLLKVEKNGS